MKYTKADVDIISLENIDIVTASEITEEQWAVIDDKYCKQHNKGNRQACSDKSMPHYTELFGSTL